MRAEYFFSFTIGSALGVALQTFLGFGYSFIALSVFLAAITLLFQGKLSEAKYRFVVPILFLGVALGAVRVDVSQSNTNKNNLDNFLRSVVRVEGIVSDEPDIRETKTNIVLEVKSINSVAVKSINILVHAPSYPLIHYGDELSVVGKISVPKNFSAQNGERPFDYRAYLAKDDIYYEMPFSKISVIGHDNGSLVLGKLFFFKEKLMRNIARMIPAPESSLGGGIVLGAKQSLGKELMQEFRDAGLAHIVVLSGYNIAVVANVIARSVAFAPFAVRLGSSAVGIILFALMVGGGATVLRATLMALVVIGARAMGRESDTLRILIFVGWIMVMINPAILLSDVSFQLSFMAALALVVLAPAIEKYFLFLKSAVLREILVTTIATQIFVAPILLYRMGTFSVVGIVANLFVLPIIPATMFFVSLVAVLAPIPLLGSISAFPAQLLLSYILSVVQIGAHIPFANIQIASFGIGTLIFSYGIIFILCTIVRRTNDEQ